MRKADHGRGIVTDRELEILDRDVETSESEQQYENSKRRIRARIDRIVEKELRVLDQHDELRNYFLEEIGAAFYDPDDPDPEQIAQLRPMGDLDTVINNPELLDTFAEAIVEHAAANDGDEQQTKLQMIADDAGQRRHLSEAVKRHLDQSELTTTDDS